MSLSVALPRARGKTRRRKPWGPREWFALGVFAMGLLTFAGIPDAIHRLVTPPLTFWDLLLLPGAWQWYLWTRWAWRTLVAWWESDE